MAKTLKKAEISGSYKNIMGTLSFDLKIKGMRKSQDFIVYPMKNADTEIKIQSDTRIGLLDLNTGKGKMSKPHSSGAYFHHLSMDKLTDFELDSNDTKELVSNIRGTGGESVGNSIVSSDNSGALLL
jgi:hypothetical protein